MVTPYFPRIDLGPGNEGGWHGAPGNTVLWIHKIDVI